MPWRNASPPAWARPSPRYPRPHFLPSTTCPNAKWRCCASSPQARATVTLPRRCVSASIQWPRMSAIFSPRPAPPTALRRQHTPCAMAYGWSSKQRLRASVPGAARPLCAILVPMEHDASYKLLFSYPRMVEDLLHGFVHEAWVRDLDCTTLERVSDSYISDDLRSRRDDLVWRVRRGPDWLYLYLLLEFQSTVDAYMAVRVLVYVGLLYQGLIRAGQVPPSGKLPPVVPIVLYNGRGRWTAPLSVEGMVEPLPRSLAPHSPRLRYVLLD